MEHGSAQALIYILVVGAIVYFRLLRPVRLSAARLWIGPALLVILTAFLVWESVQGHASLPIVGGAIVLGFVLGFPLGLLRGRHTKVEKTSNPRVLIVQPSIIPLAIWGIAFVVRFGIRYFLPHAGPVAFEASDGALAFAVGSIIGARYVIAQHFRELAAT